MFHAFPRGRSGFQEATAFLTVAKSKTKTCRFTSRTWRAARWMNRQYCRVLFWWESSVQRFRWNSKIYFVHHPDKWTIIYSWPSFPKYFIIQSYICVHLLLPAVTRAWLISTLLGLLLQPIQGQDDILGNDCHYEPQTTLPCYNVTHRIHVCYIYGNIYHQYTPNVSIYTIHGSYG